VILTNPSGSSQQSTSSAIPAVSEGAGPLPTGINVLPYAVVIFVSAFLLFQIEPILAKIVLPWFGGSAAVWTTCILFFQIILLLGYSYAHLSVRYLSPRWQVCLHVGLLVCSLALLPVIPSPAWKPLGTEEPASRILGLLAATIGLPYLLLSATSPLLQAWYTRRGRGVVPYRLFALSNLGSMLALISYPFLVERMIATRSQAVVWSVVYGGFVLLCTFVAFVSRAGNEFIQQVAKAGSRPTWKQQSLWLALSACTSTFLLAITNHLTQNVASVPFLWVVPLALYLLSFILCFESGSWYRRTIWLPLSALALGGMAFAMLGDRQVQPIAVSLPLFCGGLFVCCMAMHGELARAKPAPQYLTSFFLMCALGGALGGVFVGLMAPRIFARYTELPIVMVWCASLIYVVLEMDPPARFRASPWNPVWLGSLSGALALAFYLGPAWGPFAPGLRLAVRNFYGALLVRDSGGVRQLTNGIINHGEQILDPARRGEPTTYYGLNSGIGLTLRETDRLRNRRVGVIGLGTGTLATYGRPGDSFRFYEINPPVIQVAKTEFTYLADSKATIDVVLGDARLSLEREPNQSFDVLVVDAFTSDVVPVHLLTREAFTLYFQHLRKSGVLAVHVSNRYLDLAPVVQLAAESMGTHATLIESLGEKNHDTSLADWVLVGPPEFLEAPLIRNAAITINTRPRVRMWTDEFNNIFQILK